MFKDISVPLIVLPRASGVKVVPANATAVGAAVMALSAMVVTIGVKIILTLTLRTGPKNPNISPPWPALSLASKRDSL